MTSSRIPTEPPVSVVSSIHTFGELSEFLRSAVADQESLKFSESMGWLAAHIEAVVSALKSHPEPVAVAEMLVDLLTMLRQHRSLVVQLNIAWRQLYEYPAYLSALNQCRVMVGQWVMQAQQPGTRFLGAHEFETVAWRMLGEGALLIDVYEQTRNREREAEHARKASVLARLRAWWRQRRR
jgi:hypothetical protein